MITATCAALLGCSTSLAEPPLPFEAEYGVYRNEKRIARATVKLELVGEALYRYSRHSKGVKGLAALFNFSETETAEFTLLDGGFRPGHYQSGTRFAGRRRGWQAEFDWQKKTVSGVEDGDPFELETESGLHDPASLQFALINAFRTGQQPLEFRILDGAAIEDHKFGFEPVKGYSTALGCADGVKAERIRVNSSRYTTSWHASSAAFTLVRLDHGKHGEANNSLRLERLNIDGQTITFDDECAGSGAG